ncbi:MAG: hypothetical protein HQK77_18105 [Desulfobacterales bacterium]|nr:hypothetical protein [Desulfobacterales bacterium]
MNQLWMSIIVGLCCLYSISAFGHVLPESVYQDNWCIEQHGQTEFVLEDFTRVDCVTDTHAVEFDFGEKWAESIGQSLHYSIMTAKKAGIVLILEEEFDEIYLDRLLSIIEKRNLSIDVWAMKSYPVPDDDPLFFEYSKESDIPSLSMDLREIQIPKIKYVSPQGQTLYLRAILKWKPDMSQTVFEVIESEVIAP